MGCDVVNNGKIFQVVIRANEHACSKKIFLFRVKYKRFQSLRQFDAPSAYYEFHTEIMRLNSLTATLHL